MRVATLINQLLPARFRPVERAAARYLRWSHLVVQGGPFRGLHYIAKAHCSALAPKIAGTYEKELHPYLTMLFASHPDVFVDIGAAEGYYAVGVIAAGWCGRTIAFEADPAARASCAELMAANAITGAQLEVLGACSPDELNSVLERFQRPAILMDVEGYEAFLLDPLRIPNLRHCPIIVEHHDFLLRGLLEEICRRMTPTHEITTIEQVPRDAQQLACTDPLVSRLPASIRRRILGEQRPFSHHGWLWLEPRIPPQ